MDDRRRRHPLAGTVRSVAERDQAFRLARDTTGVARVMNHLVVLP
ncbi:MAG: BON domain-containing protein [Acidobacteria bacterium]|nr:BON domain-containing protein [Acidobacteriota bacterium]